MSDSNQKTPVETRELADAAALLENNPAVRAAFDQVEAEYIEQLSNSDPAQEQMRVNCYYMIRAVRAFRSQLQSFINSGALLKEVSTAKAKTLK